MTVYTVVLFVHAIAVLVLTAALTMEGWTLIQLRRAADPSNVRAWIWATQPIAIVAISSLVIIYVTGAYLTESLHAWENAWPRFAVLAIVIFAFFGVFTRTTHACDPAIRTYRRGRPPSMECIDAESLLQDLPE